MISRRISGTKPWLWQSVACGLLSQLTLVDSELFAQVTRPRAPSPLQRAVDGPVLQPVPTIIPVAGPGGSPSSADVNRQLEMMYRQDGRDVPEYLLEGAPAAPTQQQQSAPQQVAPAQPGRSSQQPGSQGSLQYGPAPQRNNTSNWFKPGNPGAQPQPLPQQTAQQARPIQGASAQASYTPAPQKSNPVTGFFKKIFRGKSAEVPASTAAPIPPDMVSQNLSLPPAPGADEPLPLPLAAPAQAPAMVPAPVTTAIAPVLQPAAPLMPILDAYGIPPVCPPLPGQAGPYIASATPALPAPPPVLPVIQGAPATPVTPATPANVAVQSTPQPLATPQDAPVFEPPMQRATSPSQSAGVARVKTPPTPTKPVSPPTAAPTPTPELAASQSPRLAAPVSPAPQSPTPAALPQTETAALPPVPTGGPTVSPLKPIDEIEDPFAEPAETPSMAQRERVKEPAPAKEEFEPFPEMSEDEADEILDINPFSGLTLEDAAAPAEVSVADSQMPPKGKELIEAASDDPEFQTPASMASTSEELPPLEELPAGPALEAAAPKLTMTDDDEDLSLPDLEVPPALAAPDASPKLESIPAAEPKPLSPVQEPQPEKLASTKQLSPEVEEKMRLIRERDGMTGLKGFCPVTLRDQRELKDAQTQFEAAYRGQKFHFASVEAKAKFLSDPARYAPAAYGADVVSLARDKDVVEGTLDHAAWFRGRLYLFGSQVSHDTFVQNPIEFAVATDE